MATHASTWPLASASASTDKHAPRFKRLTNGIKLKLMPFALPSSCQATAPPRDQACTPPPSDLARSELNELDLAYGRLERCMAKKGLKTARERYQHVANDFTLPVRVPPLYLIRNPECLRCAPASKDDRSAYLAQKNWSCERDDPRDAWEELGWSSGMDLFSAPATRRASVDVGPGDEVVDHSEPPLPWGADSWAELEAGKMPLGEEGVVKGESVVADRKRKGSFGHTVAEKTRTAVKRLKRLSISSKRSSSSSSG